MHQQDPLGYVNIFIFRAVEIRGDIYRIRACNGIVTINGDEVILRSRHNHESNKYR